MVREAPKHNIIMAKAIGAIDVTISILISF
jgi:hypothetical protein